MRTYVTMKARVFGGLRADRGGLAVMPSELGTDKRALAMLREAIDSNETETENENENENENETETGVPHAVGSLPGVVVDVARREAKLQLLVGDVRTTETLDLSSLTAIGDHNLSNAAVAALLVFSLDPGTFSTKALTKAVAFLDPPPHRMQRVTFATETPTGHTSGTSGPSLNHKNSTENVEWIDDSKATNVESALAGLGKYFPFTTFRRMIAHTD